MEILRDIILTIVIILQFVVIIYQQYLQHHRHTSERASLSKQNNELFMKSMSLLKDDRSYLSTNSDEAPRIFHRDDDEEARIAELRKAHG